MVKLGSSISFARSIVFFGILGLILGFLIFVALYKHIAYQDLSARYASLQDISLSAVTFSYGVIEAVDARNNTVRIRAPYRFSEREEYRILTLKVLPGSVLARQTLVAREGEADALSPRTEIRLQDIRIGERAAYSARSINGENALTVLTVGNPL